MVGDWGLCTTVKVHKITKIKLRRSLFNDLVDVVFGGLNFFFCLLVYLRPRSVSPAFVSSSCLGRNYREPSSPDEAACEPGALCALAHSTWTAPHDPERATSKVNVSIVDG